MLYFDNGKLALKNNHQTPRNKKVIFLLMFPFLKVISFLARSATNFLLHICETDIKWHPIKLCTVTFRFYIHPHRYSSKSGNSRKNKMDDGASHSDRIRSYFLGILFSRKYCKFVENSLLFISIYFLNRIIPIKTQTSTTPSVQRLLRFIEEKLIKIILHY